MVDEIEWAPASRLVQALFSRQLCAPMPDWPPNTAVTGFPFYDRHGDTPSAAELDAFLSADPPPVVFTLGSSAVMDAGRFYHVSAGAAEILGSRALLLIGDEPENRPPRSCAYSYATRLMLRTRKSSVRRSDPRMASPPRATPSRRPLRGRNVPGDQ